MVATNLTKAQAIAKEKLLIKHYAGENLWNSQHNEPMKKTIGLVLHNKNWCCQTNWLKHQKPRERALYEAIRERHSVRAASRLSLKVLRLERDLCELK